MNHLCKAAGEMGSVRCPASASHGPTPDRSSPRSPAGGTGCTAPHKLTTVASCASTSCCIPKILLKMRSCALPRVQAEQKEAEHELSACLQQLAGQQELQTQQQQQQHQRDPNHRRSVQSHQAHHQDEPALDYGAMWSALHSQAEAARAERIRLRSLGRGGAAGGPYGGARAYAVEGQKGAAGAKVCVRVCVAGAAWSCTRTVGAGHKGTGAALRVATCCELPRAADCHVLGYTPRTRMRGG